MTQDFPHASVLDGIRFTAQIGVPNIVQGLFSKRELPVKIASRLGTDHHGYQLVEGLVGRYGPGPFYVRVAKDETLVVTHPEDLKFMLGASPDPFASDPDPKVKGMSAFQPDALTISRGDLWAQRRAFAHAVCEPDSKVHSLATAWTGIAADAARELAGRPIRWQEIDAAFLRVIRRVVLGESAADDTRVTDLLGALMAQGNSMPGKPGPEYPEFIAMIQKYIDRADPGSLASLVSGAPAPPGGAAGQMVHWMFALKANEAANVLRALAVLATHPEQQREARSEIAGADLSTAAGVASLDYLGGCLLEAMRLWPTVGLLVKVAHRDVTFPSGAVLPEGKQVMVYNVFNHRNRALIPYADRFSPAEWVSGTAGADWSFNFFSHGPQNCPGAGISVFLGQAVMANLLNAGPLSVSGVRLDPGKPLPHGVDLYGITVHAGT